MLYITVKLFGRTGLPGEFRAYEQKALDIFRRHGGEVIAAYAPVPDPARAENPDEIQILKIPDQAGFQGFLADPERLALSAERETVIRKTEVYLSDRIIAY